VAACASATCDQVCKLEYDSETNHRSLKAVVCFDIQITQVAPVHLPCHVGALGQRCADSQSFLRNTLA